MSANLNPAWQKTTENIKLLREFIQVGEVSLRKVAGCFLNLKEKMSDEDQTIRTCGNSLCVHR